MADSTAMDVQELGHLNGEVKVETLGMDAIVAQIDEGRPIGVRVE